MTGAMKRDDAPKEFEEVVINIDRVARVVKGGRRFRFKALVVVGNHKIKSASVLLRVQMCKRQLQKQRMSPRSDGLRFQSLTTIPHDMEVKLSGARVLIKPRSAWYGYHCRWCGARYHRRYGYSQLAFEVAW